MWIEMDATLRNLPYFFGVYAIMSTVFFSVFIKNKPLEMLLVIFKKNKISVKIKSAL